MGQWGNTTVRHHYIPPSKVSNCCCSQRHNWSRNRTTGIENGWLMSLVGSLSPCNVLNMGVKWWSFIVIRGLSAVEVTLDFFSTTDAAPFPLTTIDRKEITPKRLAVGYSSVLSVYTLPLWLIAVILNCFLNQPGLNTTQNPLKPLVISGPSY